MSNAIIRQINIGPPREPNPPNPLNTPDDPPHGWPTPLNEDAYIGLAGNFIRLVLPETEGDPAALLLSFLTMFGCAVGRNPCYQVGATRHGANLYTLIVGDTAKARKGTAVTRVKEIFSRVDPEFCSTRIKSGLSSGEGLIEAVRDPSPPERASKTRKNKGDADVPAVADPNDILNEPLDLGRGDKRLLVIENEFGSVLHHIGREGNILSEVLREAWDGNPLQVLARNNKDSCAEPHIALIGSITNHELQALLSRTARFNGFGNRLLFCCARRSKLLPDGGRPLEDLACGELLGDFASAIEAARSIHCVTRDPEASEIWQERYASLARGIPGSVGDLTARGEAQVLRLSAIYSLLDCSPLIRREHLRAALEVWRYCDESVRFLFGDRLGDDSADRILEKLKNAPAGMSGTEINRLFSSHKKSSELEVTLKQLERLGRVKCESRPTNGATATIWTFVA